MSRTESQVKDGLLIVRQVDEERCIRLSLEGELDLANAITVEAQLDAALLSGKKVLVDLSELEFLDSTGINLIVTTLRRPEGSRLSFLPSKSAGVRRLFILTGLDARLPLASGESAPAVSAA